MTRILLDTSAYAALMSGKASVADAVRGADDVYLNAIVLGELRGGFARGSHHARNERQLAEFMESPRASVIEVDDETAVRYGVIYDTLRKARTPIPTNDIWIAASAMQYGLQLVTLNAHFARVPQVLTDLR
jgi:tRNA(fMet)-specific endonuclease VapC